HDRGGEDRPRGAGAQPGRHGQGAHDPRDPRGREGTGRARRALPHGEGARGRGLAASPRAQGMAGHHHSPGFLALVNDAKKRIRQVTIEEYLRRMKDGEKLVLVDTREDNEWEEKRIPGAVHLGKGVIERDVEAAFPDKATPLVLYCGGGFRTALAADNLQKMGYTNVV